MFVSYDNNGNVIRTSEKPPVDESYIEVPKQSFVSLAGMKIVNGLLEKDVNNSSYKEDLREKISKERDKRIKAGFQFQGKLYDFDPDTKLRIAGASIMALYAIVNGAIPGDYTWADPSGSPFSWIANDNSMNLMDAYTCFTFGGEALKHERLHIFKARVIKDMSPIPENFTDDSFWV